MMIVIAAGGTGGHLYPAVALAREFLRRDPSTTVLFVGTARGLESKVLNHEGFDLALINAKPVMGKGLWGIVTGLCAMPVSLGQCLSILKARRADLVIGIGGYTSPMMILAAALRGIVRVILEPNANPGMANKAAGPLAHRVFLAFESAADSFDRSKVRVVGTPIRKAFLENSYRGRQKSRSFHLLVFGGSQGAKAVNTAVMGALPELMTQLPQLTATHQTGDSDHARVAETYRLAGIESRVEAVPFLYDMPAALQEADLVIARAGAMTVAELTACGKPAILIPLPSAIYDHQTKNAKVMEAAGGAVVLSQSMLTGPALARTVMDVLGNPERLRGMGAASLSMRRIDAAEAIVHECYLLMGDYHDVNHSVGAAGI
jgi:UDP-N-acetylglucosamine--N-acetylmuramyl-(pentapeptide) pyrophosphoryl-undecaprenol N-acetylglucosamine transferase